jgi:glycosyltransferase involved in cell wall biosynthesis
LLSPLFGLAADEVRSATKVKVAYVTTSGAPDVTLWSGLGYFIARSLQAPALSLEHIGPLREKYRVFFMGKQAFYRYLFRQRHLRDREPTILRGYAKQVSKNLRCDHEIIFSPGTIPIAYLECEQPIAFWTDATFAAIVGFYPSFSNLSAESIRHGHAMEQSALHRARLAIYSSDWAAESAVTDYGVRRDQVAVVPFGANFEVDITTAQARAAIEGRLGRKCRLLFIGAEWERKGGEVAVCVASALNEAGLETELDIVGCDPRGDLPRFVNRLGFISKAEPDGKKKLRELLMQSHFLVLPARAECFGVVLCEANAHALPVLATRVGGIPTIVRDDVNGRLFSTDATPDEYSSYVIDVMARSWRYRELALSSFEEYRQRLNWAVAGATVRRLLEGIVASS